MPSAARHRARGVRRIGRRRRKRRLRRLLATAEPCRDRTAPPRAANSTARRTFPAHSSRVWARRPDAATAGCSTIVGNCTRCASAVDAPIRHHAAIAQCAMIPDCDGGIAFKLGTENERWVSAPESGVLDWADLNIRTNFGSQGQVLARECRHGLRGPAATGFASMADACQAIPARSDRRCTAVGRGASRARGVLTSRSAPRRTWPTSWLARRHMSAALAGRGRSANRRPRPRRTTAGGPAGAAWRSAWCSIRPIGDLAGRGAAAAIAGGGRGNRRYRRAAGAPAPRGPALAERRVCRRTQDRRRAGRRAGRRTARHRHGAERQQFVCRGTAGSCCPGNQPVRVDRNDLRSHHACCASCCATLQRAAAGRGDGSAAFGRRFQALCLQVGHELTLEAGGQQSTGCCAGIAPDGALLLETAQGLREFYSGVLRHYETM